jgi:small subunit ribosomal protein S6e
MKIVYSDPKTGKSAQMALEGEKANALLNYKINDTIDGGLIGLQGYKLKITGGSDSSGFPLTKGIGGAIKTGVLKKIAISGRNKGVHERRTVRGSTITNDTAQVNVMIMEYGSTPVSELFPEKKVEVKEAAQ